MECAMNDSRACAAWEGLGACWNGVCQCSLFANVNANCSEANVDLVSPGEWEAYRVATTVFGAAALYIVGSLLLYQFRHGHYEKAPTLGAGALLLAVLARIIATYVVEPGTGPRGPGRDNLLYFRWLTAMSNVALVIYQVSLLPAAVTTALGTRFANGTRLPSAELRRDKKLVWRISAYGSLLVAALFLAPTCYGFFTSAINFDIGELVMNVGGLIIVTVILTVATGVALVRGVRARAHSGPRKENGKQNCGLDQLVAARAVAIAAAIGMIVIYIVNGKAPVPLSWFLPLLNLANVCHGLAVISGCIVNGHHFRAWIGCRAPVLSERKQRGRPLIKNADRSRSESCRSV